MSQLQPTLPLSHGVDHPPTQQAIKQLETRIRELQTYTVNLSTVVNEGGGNPSFTPSVSVASDVPVGDINLSTEGTIDWVWAAGWFSGTVPFGAQIDVVRSKRDGGWLFDTLTQLPYGITPTTNNGLSWTHSTNGNPDDAYNGAALSPSHQQFFIYTSSSSQLNFGFKGRVPAPAGQARKLRIYGGQFSCQATLTAKLSVSGTTATIAADPGAGVGSSQRYTVDFTGGADGDELLFAFTVTANHGSSPNIVLSAITLATS